MSDVAMVTREIMGEAVYKMVKSAPAFRCIPRIRTQNLTPADRREKWKSFSTITDNTPTRNFETLYGLNYIHEETVRRRRPLNRHKPTRFNSHQWKRYGIFILCEWNAEWELIDKMFRGWLEISLEDNETPIFSTE